MFKEGEVEVCVGVCKGLGYFGCDFCFSSSSSSSLDVWRLIVIRTANGRGSCV